jgi:hypothetical protein
MRHLPESILQIQQLSLGNRVLALLLRQNPIRPGATATKNPQHSNR